MHCDLTYFSLSKKNYFLSATCPRFLVMNHIISWVGLHNLHVHECSRFMAESRLLKNLQKNPLLLKNSLIELCQFKEGSHKSGCPSVRYPLLSQLANIPSSVPCERVFSHAGHVVNDTVNAK